MKFLNLVSFKTMETQTRKRRKSFIFLKHSKEFLMSFRIHPFRKQIFLFVRIFSLSSCLVASSFDLWSAVNWKRVQLRSPKWRLLPPSKALRSTSKRSGQPNPPSPGDSDSFVDLAATEEMWLINARQSNPTRPHDLRLAPLSIQLLTFLFQ